MEINSGNKTFRFVLLIIVAGLSFIFVWQGNYITSSKDVETQAFYVEKGMGVSQIASKLKDADLIKSKSLFIGVSILLGKHNGLMAGPYNLSSDMNVSEIITKMHSGDVIKEILTIIEGWNLRNIAWTLENKGMFQAEELFEIAGFPAVDYNKPSELPNVKDFSETFTFLKEKPDNISLEGYLFPDTYHIEKDESIEVILNKIFENFDKKITNELKQEIRIKKKTLFEILTMASLLEKEVQTYTDKQMVAGILWKRIRNSWPLQVDASLTYLTGRASAQLTQNDFDIDSFYNTYKYRGLPMGPICNPGLESIKAAINYTESPYWFYLSADDGTTIFSKTLEEHAINKQKYLR